VDANRFDDSGVCSGGADARKIITVWELILIAFLVGIVNAFDVPIRQAFFVQMVGKEDLPMRSRSTHRFSMARALWDRPSRARRLRGWTRIT